MAYASEPVSTCVNCSVTPPAKVGPYLLAEWLWKVSASRPIFCSISTINFNLRKKVVGQKAALSGPLEPPISSFGPAPGHFRWPNGWLPLYCCKFWGQFLARKPRRRNAQRTARNCFQDPQKPKSIMPDAFCVDHVKCVPAGTGCVERATKARRIWDDSQYLRESTTQ